MFFFSYTAATLTFFIVSAAVFLFYKKWGDPLATSLASMMLATSAWLGFNVLADFAVHVDTLVFASGFAAVSGLLVVGFCLWFIEIFLTGTISRLWRLIYLSPAGLFLLGAFSSYSVAGVSFPPGQPAQIEPGPLYLFASLFILVALSYGFLRIWRAYHFVDLTRRLQSIYMGIGFIGTILGGLMFDVILPLFGVVHLYNVGPQFSVFMLGCSAYAILRHRLLDVRIVIQLGVVYSLLIATIVVCYMCVLLLAELFLGPHLPVAIPVSAAIIMIIGIFTVPRLESFFRQKTDRFFFKGAYEYSTALESLSHIVYTNIEFDNLVASAEIYLKTIFRAESVHIKLIEPDAFIQEGGRVTPSVPIVLDGKRIGVIEVGRKRSGDEYQEKDLRLLTTFACQAATALSRARLYQETKRHARELTRMVQERTKELRLAQEHEHQTIVDLSHGLQTSLAILQTKIERAKRSVLHNAEIHPLEETLHAISRFMYDLLALSHLEQTTKAKAHARLDFSALLKDICEEIRIIASPLGISVRTKIPPDLFICGNEKHVSDAIMNIGSNALKYMKDDKEKKVAFLVDTSPKGIVLRIQDSGIGISKTDLPHIFDRFYRGKNVPYDASGNGLGLALVKQIMERHGGSATAESILGKGSTFTLTFPYPDSVRPALRART